MTGGALTVTPPAPPVTSDEQLARARAGDERAWRDIVAEIGPRLRGYARAKGTPDPDDVMQDVLLAAAEHLGDFEGDGSAFRSWVFSIAYRKIADRHRVSGRETPIEHLPEVPHPSPEHEIEERESASAALAALDVLDGVERDVVLMRVLGEMDTPEVAAAVGKTEGNVRVIQHRALEKVRAELERTGYRSRAAS